MKCSDKISIGEYVRTDNGIIGEYVKFRGWQDAIETNNDWIGFDIDKDITKHSKDIIDLIEVDDIGIMNCYGLKVKKFITKDDILELKCRNYELLSIITKEQIKQIEYRIKE